MAVTCGNSFNGSYCLQFSLSSRGGGVQQGEGDLAGGGGLAGGWGEGVGGGGQGTFHPPCHILHYHMVLRPEGTSHNKQKVMSQTSEHCQWLYWKTRQCCSRSVCLVFFQAIFLDPGKEPRHDMTPTAIFLQSNKKHQEIPTGVKVRPNVSWCPEYPVQVKHALCFRGFGDKRLNPRGTHE